MKRKLTEADGRHVVAARLRKDLSAIFELPCVPHDVAPAPQPAAFVGALYAYQRRSLARMLEIERGEEQLDALDVPLGCCAMQRRKAGLRMTRNSARDHARATARESACRAPRHKTWHLRRAWR